MEAWYKVHELINKVGIITDYYCEYIELKDVRTGEYHIVHESKVKLIKEK